MEGVLYKRGKHIPSWNERYFVLKNVTLAYFQKAGDRQSRGMLVLRPDCRLTEVELCKRKAHKPLYAFTIMWSSKTGNMVSNSSYNEFNVQVGCEIKEQAYAWRDAIEKAIEQSIYSNSSDPSARSGNNGRDKAGKLPTSVVLLSAMERSLTMFSGKWEVETVCGSLQVWKEEKSSDISHRAISIHELNAPPINTLLSFFGCGLAVLLGGGGVIVACLLGVLAAICSLYHHTQHLIKGPVSSYKMSKVVPDSPDVVFETLINTENRPTWDSSVEKATVIQTIDRHSDIIHVILKPIHIWPIHVKARDLCLLRYWRQEDDGSYIVCMQSARHPECPESSQYVRAECAGGGFTIASKHANPTKAGQTGDKSCLVTCVINMDPKGYATHILRRLNLFFQYIKPQILALAGLKSTIEACKFVPVDLSTELISVRSTTEASDSTKNGQIKDTSINEPIETEADFPCSLPRYMWTEPPTGSMLVRGPDYLSDRRKIPSASPLLKLMGVDLFETDGPYEHIASHPENIIQTRLKKYHLKNEKMPFTFVLNFVIPGSKHLSLVLYYVSYDSSLLTTPSTPAAELFQDFLEGSDSFRDSRFKLIPCIVEGTYIVRQAVGSTPAIIGKKLRQPYYRGDQYFELDIDICSSMVANRVTGLVLGYTKKLVIDMGFLVEGQTMEELPEQLFGSIRLQHVDLGIVKKLSKPKKMDSIPSNSSSTIETSTSTSQFTNDVVGITTSVTSSTSSSTNNSPSNEKKMEASH